MEAYRALAERAVGRTIEAVHAPDEWYLKGISATELGAALLGTRLAAARRRGKLLLLDTSGPTLGLRFGMTGRLLLDGVAGVDQLIHAPRRSDPAWERLVLRLSGGGELKVADPRRLGGVSLDPPEHRLGPDATAVRTAELAAILHGSRAPLKARLMDQGRLAGLGNLLVDEALWRAGLNPGRPAGSLERAEVRRLAGSVRSTLTELIRRGGSHTGDLMPARRQGGLCPRDGEPLARGVVGGRTTYWCPRHQV